MIPKFLRPEVVPFVEILLAGLPVAQPSAVICAWCLSVLREGSAPVSHGICPACFDRDVSESAVSH